MEKVFHFFGSTDHEDVFTEEYHNEQLGASGAANGPNFDNVALRVLGKIGDKEAIAEEIAVLLVLAYQYTV